MRRRWTWWCIPLLMCAASVVATVLVVYWCRTVPLDQCSEVYQRYHDVPGIRAAFIRDKQINDTLKVDMTLLVADDSLAFANLLKSIGKSDEFITDILSLGGTPDKRYSRSFRRGELGSLGDSNDANNEVESVFPIRRAVAFFHTRTAVELITVLHKNYHNEVDIN